MFAREKTKMESLIWVMYLVDYFQKVVMYLKIVVILKNVFFESKFMQTL